MRTHVVKAFPFVSLLALAAALAPTVARAADSTWTNYQGTTYFLTNANMWSAGVPGAGDTAVITNPTLFSNTMILTNVGDVAMANVTVGLLGTTATYLKYTGPGAWTVTNRFAVNDGLAYTGIVQLAGGTIAVTNAAKSAEFSVGTYPGLGLAGVVFTRGTLVADRLTMTNQPSSVAFSDGKLTVLNGMQVVMVNAGSGNLTFGNSAGQSMEVWTLGGSNQVTSADAGASFNIGSSAGSTGLWVIAGPSTWVTNRVQTAVNVGNAGLGRMVISNGASAVTVNNNLYLGYQLSASNSSILVSGSGTTWTNTGALNVGGAGLFVTNASLVVADGAKAAVGGRLLLYAAAVDTPGVLVTGSGSTLSSAEGRLDGGSAMAMVVSNGGRYASTAAIQVGRTLGRSSKVVVTGTNSMMVGSAINVGSNSAAANLGIGFLLIKDGGGIEVLNSLANGSGGMGVISNQGGIYQFNNNAPTVTTNTPGGIVLENGAISYRGVTGVNFTNNQPHLRITQVGDSTIRFVTATNLAMTSYTFQTNNPGQYAHLSLDSGGRFMATNAILVAAGSRISGNGTVESKAVTNSGSIAPGNSPGLLSFSSNLTLTASSLLSLEIAGTNSGAFDRVVVGGTLDKAGSVEVSLLSYNPSEGDSFDLLDWGAMLGSFAALNLPSLSGGLQWDSAQFESQGILMVVNAIPEPSVLVLGALGAGLALALRRRSS
jgi:T5SS/PEP-CTERM-associated repeat protein